MIPSYNHSMIIIVLCYVSFMVCVSETTTVDGILHRERRQLLWTNSTLLQLNIGVTTPTPIKTINVGWAIQANFQLPWNRSQIPFDLLEANSGYTGFSRRRREAEDYENDAKLYHFYKYVEEMLNSYGHNGTWCVLHALCQLGAEPLHADDEDNLLHDLVTFILKLVALFDLGGGHSANTRQRRYLLFTKDTQWGVFATISIPLHPESTTSVAWFYEANYYNVDNATYFQPLLGDIPWGRNQEKRSADNQNGILTRTQLYGFTEAMLHKHGYAGRPCLLRAICEAATASLTRNGVLGDLLHLALTPSASMEETELEDCFYEAEYRGLDHDCSKYTRKCPSSPLDYISVEIETLM